MKNNTLFPKPKINNIFYTVVLIFFTTITFGQSGSCSAELRVHKDRNVRSTPPEGTYYSLVLTNKGLSADNFSLSTLNINSSCSNSDGSPTSGNVNLSAAFFDADLKPINELLVSSGQTIHFFVQITVPAGTPINKWNCAQVIAQSTICTDYKVNTFINTLVINPNDN